ncbi:MAG TPA: cytochrome B [Flavilitoribacter sp.]|nr:cytochrome B [Lewinella sp.]MCB9278345.1 cytochrome B [Lewinellaceae bacterium]HMQ63947.1 cytochrome B [Flavilitoribacter sp.]
MYVILRQAHSGLRWVILLLIVAAIVQAWNKWQKKSPFEPKKQRLALFALIVTHLQLLLGVILYFVSPKVAFGANMMKDPVTRFFSVEHVTLMALAVALITMGYSRSKRSAPDAKGFKILALFYLAGLVLLLAGIPWPFRNLGAGWF